MPVSTPKYKNLFCQTLKKQVLIRGFLLYSQDQTEQSELGSSKQKKRKRMSPFELSQIIVENGITTRAELLAFADEQSGEGKTDIAEFVVNRGS